MALPLRLLLVEDNSDDMELLLLELRRGGFAPDCLRVETREAMDEALRGQEWDLVVADYAMPHFSGLAALELLKESGFDLPFILVSGTVGEEQAVEAMKAGAHDYLLKGKLTRLTAAVRRELRDAEERRKRRAAEKALAAQMQDLIRSNAELEQFAYIASHDLQEPLRMVANYTEFLAHRYGDRLDQDGKQFVRYVTEGVTRMDELIRDLLQFSKAGRLDTKLAALDSSEAFQDAVANLREAIAASGANVAAGPLPKVMADRQQLVQLFQNLIGNAVKFRSETAPEVRVSAEKKGNEWVFSVRDNGIGIDPKYQERIFVIFQRLHNREKYPGTGIGLAICKRIVERHGGRIWLESQPGRGATFHFSLPSGS